MENLTISEMPPQEARGMPQPPAQLPPQMFTTAAQLLDLTDKKLMVVLRDGRKLVGVLRSWDQFANIVLQSTTERIFAPSSSPTSPGLYADVHHGIFLVRGENVVVLGEIDLDKDDLPPPGYELGELEAVKKIADQRKNVEKVKEKNRLKKLAGLGFEGDVVGDAVI
ncbi:Putative U6 snRNA-associated Sm-like protein LSm1 [[Torrubiella] hemipterigena]|uniref:U6 snRNA-associated Sm-like protein LSm1 n=1 Tax=[Torrubiella] hemipterigena TaxID=1531966 RepID=A0A0A1TGG7_9HYPO|nr:Putative U6 snRNA-associated Sm-like protein LSm1 [[Torrubiella] hemipterigena]